MDIEKQSEDTGLQERCDAIVAGLGNAYESRQGGLY